MSGMAAMILACAVNSHPTTVAAVIRVESGGNPFAVNINGPRVLSQPRTAAEAATVARRGIAQGYSVDVGLMQVNSRNFKRLGLTIDTALDPCTNISAGTRILAENYKTAIANGGPGQKALQSALSRYNTGSPTRGFNNGYVARYYRLPPAGARPSHFYADPYTASSSVTLSPKERSNAEPPKL